MSDEQLVKDIENIILEKLRYAKSWGMKKSTVSREIAEACINRVKSENSHSNARPGKKKKVEVIEGVEHDVLDQDEIVDF